VSSFQIRTPPRLPTPPERLIGRVLQIPADQCRYRERTLFLLVTRVRIDISQWYGGNWVWLEGDEIDRQGRRLTTTSELVHVSVCALDPPAKPQPRPGTPGH
jgi:hypothetical protein